MGRPPSLSAVSPGRSDRQLNYHLIEASSAALKDLATHGVEEARANLLLQVLTEDARVFVPGD